MTEASFDNQRKAIDKILKEAAQMRLDAGILEQQAHNWLAALLNDAKQEPWWGEAND